MKKNLLLTLSLIVSFYTYASYNNGFFDNFTDKVNLTKVRYDNTIDANNVIGVNGNDGMWAGIGPNGEAPGTASLPYSIIPAMVITNDNKLVVMYDTR